MAKITIPLTDPDQTIKEVFSNSGIETKTELRSDQIETVNKLKTLSQIFGIRILDDHVHKFLLLQKSKDRKSMGEFVEALRSKKEELVEKAKSFHLMG